MVSWMLRGAAEGARAKNLVRKTRTRSCRAMSMLLSPHGSGSRLGDSCPAQQIAATRGREEIAELLNLLLIVLVFRRRSAPVGILPNLWRRSRNFTFASLRQRRGRR